MSRYTTCRLEIRDAEALVAALKERGLVAETFLEAQPLYGYQGDLRPEKAHVIVRRKYIGPASNDIGFLCEPDGHYTAIISEWDRGRFNQRFLAALTRRVAVLSTTSRLVKGGFTVKVIEEEDGRTRIVARRLG